MKKLLHKSCQWLLMLIAMFAVSMSASAGTKAVTLDLNDYEWTMNRYQFVKDGVTASFNAGSADGQYNLYGYGTGNLYLDSPDADIVKVEMECVAFRGVSPNVYYAAQVCQWTGEYNANATSFTNMSTTDDGIAIWEGTPARTLYFTASDDMDVRALTVYINDGNDGDGGEVTPDPIVKPNFPVEGTAYQIQLANSSNYTSLGYLNVAANTNSCTFGAEPEALYFTWVESEGAFTIKDADGNYIGGASNTWTIGYNVPEYWTVTEARDGVYTFKSKTSGYLGFNTSSGTAYRNCTENDDVYFKLEAYQAPAVDPVDPGTGGGTTGVVLNFDFSAAGNGTLTQSPVTVTYSRGSEGGKSVASLSMWNDPLVFTSTGANIVKIELTGVNLDKLTASGYTNPVWEGNAKSVTFNFTGAAFDYAYVTNAAVTLEGTPEPTLYQYRVAFEDYPDGTVPSLTCNNITWTQNEVINWRGGDYITEDDIEVTPIEFYDYDVAITHPQGEGEGRILVTYTPQPLYQYRVAFESYPDGTEPSLTCNGVEFKDQYVINWRGGDYITEDDFTVNELTGYTYEVAITHPQAGEGRITVTFTERPVNYFTIPAEAFRKDIDVTYDSDWNEVPTSMYFRVLASDVPGVDSFKRNDNGKQITAQLSADGAESRNAYLTIYGSYDGSQASVKPFDLALEGKAFSVTFPKGAFEAANGDLSEEFTYSYDPAANRVTYTFNFFNSDTSASVPADLAVVYANNPEGDHYTTGSSYVALYTPTVTDFKSLNPYWEIDPDRSNVNGTNINLYFTQQSYKYDVIIEGKDNAVVTVKGQDYSHNQTVETYELLRTVDVTFHSYKGYNLYPQIQQPEDGKGGVIYAKYEVKEADYASVDRTDPATGDYELNDHLDGLSSVNVYLDGDDFTQFGYYASDGNMPEGINITDAQGNVTNYTVSGIMSWDGYSYCIVNLATPIKEAGIYTINIPAGVLPLADEEKTSPEMHLTYDVKAATMFDFGRQAAQPFGQTKDGGGLRTLEGFKVTIPSDVEIHDYDLVGATILIASYDSDYNLVKDDVVPAGFKLNADDNSISITFDEPFAPEASESYTFILPAGSITATDGRTNKEISLSASVDPMEYFDLVVTYPAEDNAAAPVDHMVIQLPEGFQVQSVDDSSIYFNGHNATVEKFEQNGLELTITFADNAAEAGDYASYYIPSGAITGTALTPDATAAVRMANSTAQQYNIPVTAAPVEYRVEFEGWPFETHAPQVTYDGDVYYGDKHIVATDLTVEQLTATDADGYGYVITIDQPGYAQSHGFGRVLVTYTAKEYAAVSRVSPAEGEISLDNADGLGSITIFMDGEAGWDADVYCGGGNPVPAGVSMVGPNGAIELPWEGSAYGFCMWEGSTQINVNFGGTLKTPGTYTLIIPAGLNTIGGKENPRMEYSWTVKEATTFEFDRYTEALGDRNNDGVLLSLNGFTVALPENLSDISTEVPGSVGLYITVSTGDEMSEEPAEPTLVSSTYSITDGVVTFTFPEAYTEKGRVSVTLNANIIGINGLSNKAFSTSFNVDPNPTQYIELASATAETKYTAFNEITEYSVTSSSDLWSGIVLDITAEMFADKTITVSYYTQEEGTVNLDASVASVSEANGVVTFQFTEPVTIPFDTWYSVIFPAGFITFDVDNIQSRTARFNNHKVVESYVYDVVYDETVPEGASLLQNGITIPVSKESFGGPVQVESADFTATTVAGKQPVVTVVQPTREQPIGTVTLSYETIEPVPFNGQFTLNGTPSNLGNDWLSSITSITVPAPEGHTFASAEDCVLLFKGNIDSDYVTYDSEATISEDGSEVTITLKPAYSKPGFDNHITLAEGSLFLDNGAEYAGFNCSFTLFPEYAFDIDHTDPADRAAIYNGDLDHIDVYLPAGLNVGYNTDFGIEVVGTDYVESFQPSYISNFGDFYRIQLPSSMSLPAGRITVTIPSDVFYYYDYENNDRYVTNAPYTLWIDNFSALQLVAEPAAGTVVGLDAIRVKGERGTLWSANTDAEALAQHITFGTWEGPVAVTTAIENGVLVVTPVETLAEGNYTLSIDGLAGVLESADVAASVNAPARFEFNVVGSTFAFQSAQPSSYQTLEGFEALETIVLNLPYNVEAIDEVNEQTPIQLVLLDAEGNATQEVVGLTYAHAGEDERGYPCVQLIGKITGAETLSPDGKYRVQLNVPAGIVTSSNGRTNEAATFQFSIDTNKYFAVSPNFQSYGHVTGPVKTFTLTAAEGVTFTGIASDEDVDRPTVYKNGALLTWANPAISADGKSVTLTLAEPISAESPNDQYYLVVPAGLFTGTVTTEEGVTFPATSTGIDAWREAFYVDAPAYDHVEIAGPVENGESITSYGGYIYVYVNKTIGGDEGIPEGTTFTSADGQSVDINSMWSVWSSDYSYFVVNTASNLQPGTYTLHVPADSHYADGVIDFTFTLVETFDLADGTFAPTGTVEAQTLESFTWTAPEGKTIQSVDLTKIGNGAYDSNWNWVFTPLAGLTYEIAGEKNQVVFTLAEPITVPEGQTTASLNLSFQGAAIVCADGSMSKSGSYYVTIDPFPNDISRDGKEDVDDVNAIADIILQTDKYWQYNSSKADQNGDHEVTIGDLVKYIEYLKTQSAEDNDTPIDEEEDEEL